MTEFTLHIDRFWISPYSFSSFLALKEKSLPFEVREIALDAGENHGEPYRSDSFTGKIPALRHGDFWLAESSAIAEYLDETFGSESHPPLLPADRPNRARARMVMAWLRSDLLALREERSTHTMFYAPAQNPLSGRCLEEVQTLFDFCRLIGAEGERHLFGAWSLADSELSFMLHRLILNGHQVPEPVRAYACHQWRRPSVREFVERKRMPYVPY